jgi:hypothetical protein
MCNFTLEKGYLKKIYLFALLVLWLAVLAYTDVAKAQWSAINSGYAVTTNWHGIDVPIGQRVVATAGTTDSAVTHVVFIWRNSSENIVWVDNVTVSELSTPNVPSNVSDEVVKWANENQGICYRYAQSAKIPNMVGEWGVQAIFYNATKPQGNPRENFVVKKATSINVIPDAPVVGTAGLVSAMAFGLGLFKLKQKKN